MLKYCHYDLGNSLIFMMFENEDIQVFEVKCENGVLEKNRLNIIPVADKNISYEGFLKYYVDYIKENNLELTCVSLFGVSDGDVVKTTK